MKAFVLLTCLILLLGISSCSNKAALQNAIFFTADSAKQAEANALYTGKLSNQNCPEIQIMLKLHRDQTYSMETRCTNEADEIIRSEGKFRLRKHKLLLAENDTILMPTQFTIEDNRLVPEGQKVNAVNSSEKFYLEKSTDPILERYWKLLILNGRQVTAPENSDRVAHLILKVLNNRAFGNGGCNGFSGTYTLAKGNRISFSRIISTKMACMEINFESDFLHALESADGYSVNGDTLQIMAHGISTASFIEVK